MKIIPVDQTDLELAGIETLAQIQTREPASYNNNLFHDSSMFHLLITDTRQAFRPTGHDDV